MLNCFFFKLKPLFVKIRNICISLISLDIELFFTKFILKALHDKNKIFMFLKIDDFSTFHYRDNEENV